MGYGFEIRRMSKSHPHPHPACKVINKETWGMRGRGLTTRSGWSDGTRVPHLLKEIRRGEEKTYKDVDQRGQGPPTCRRISKGHPEDGDPMRRGPPTWRSKGRVSSQPQTSTFPPLPPCRLPSWYRIFIPASMCLIPKNNCGNVNSKLHARLFTVEGRLTDIAQKQ
jgi:hypothetical protein